MLDPISTMISDIQDGSEEQFGFCENDFLHFSANQAVETPLLPFSSKEKENSGLAIRLNETDSTESGNSEAQ